MVPPDGNVPLPSRAAFSVWLDDRPVPTMSTNAGTTALAFQSWRNFKESFAPELIEQAVSETTHATSSKIEHILDPFGGSGTTALASQFLGIFPTTIEVNPYLADLIESKLQSYDFERLKAAYLQVIGSSVTSTKTVERHLPPTFVEPGTKGRYLFSQAVAERLLGYRHAIESAEIHENDRRLLKAILTSCAVDLSNAVVSGKGRRYRRNWIERQKSSADVELVFRRKMEGVLFDIRMHGQRPEPSYCLLRGDARELTQQVHGIDLTIFSPPYPNSFDYTDVYNIELWMGGYLGGPQDNRTLRKSTLRSHVQITTEVTQPDAASASLATTLDQLEAKRSDLWSPHIPGMISSYFSDMLTICRNVRRGSNADARLYMVVGDSRYAGVTVPVAQILAELCKDDQFELIGMTPFRSMRASPQQGGQADLPETLITLAV